MGKKKIEVPGFVMTPQYILGGYFPYYVIGLYNEVKNTAYWSNIDLCFQSLGTLASAGRISDELVSRELKVLQYFNLIKYEGFTEHDTFAFSVPVLSFETKKMVEALPKNTSYKDWAKFSTEIAAKVYRSKDHKISVTSLIKEYEKKKNLVDIEDLGF